MESVNYKNDKKFDMNTNKLKVFETLINNNDEQICLTKEKLEKEMLYLSQKVDEFISSHINDQQFTEEHINQLSKLQLTCEKNATDIQKNNKEISNFANFSKIQMEEVSQ